MRSIFRASSLIPCRSNTGRSSEGSDLADSHMAVMSHFKFARSERNIDQRKPIFKRREICIPRHVDEHDTEEEVQTLIEILFVDLCSSAKPGCVPDAVQIKKLQIPSNPHLGAEGAREDEFVPSGIGVSESARFPFLQQVTEPWIFHDFARLAR